MKIGEYIEKLAFDGLKKRSPKAQHQHHGDVKMEKDFKDNLGDIFHQHDPLLKYGFQNHIDHKKHKKHAKEKRGTKRIAAVLGDEEDQIDAGVEDEGGIEDVFLSKKEMENVSFKQAAAQEVKNNHRANVIITKNERRKSVKMKKD